MSGAGAAIELRGCGKRYWKLEERAGALRSLLPFARPARSELWALRGVDLAVAPGETLGVLGRNGAGKSTLLRMLAGVTRPSEGEVEVAGRVAPLLSVGVGFHPEMTGRENVYVNGMLLGLTRAEVDERVDDVVGFAELRDFIDTPVKFYSSGMFMRLGFSVAVHTEPQVLLVDEVLAVGDIAFQMKSLERMRSMQDRGTTIVIVSHATSAIRLLCPRAAVFHRGTMAFDGEVDQAIATHLELLGNTSTDTGLHLHDRTDRGAVTIREQVLVGSDGAAVAVAEQDTPLVLRAELRFEEDVESPQVLFVVRGEDGGLAYRAHSTIGTGRDSSYSVGSTATVEVPFVARFGGGGTFGLEFFVTDQDGRDVLGRSGAPTIFYVPPRYGILGVADLGARILLDGEAVDHHQPLDLRGAPPAPADGPPPTS